MITKHRIQLLISTLQRYPRHIKKTSQIRMLKHKELLQYVNHNIYILDVFTEKPYNKALECSEVYIPITTSNHATSMTSK